MPDAPDVAGWPAAAPALAVVPPFAVAGALLPPPLLAAGIMLAGAAGEPAVLLTLLDCAGMSLELEQPSRHDPQITKYFA
jgi:hypothetical protein